MPGIMFQDVVCSRSESNSTWYTVPLSCLVHTTVLAVIVAIPLIVTDMTLPTPRSLMEQYVSPYMPIVPQPPAMRHVAPAQTTHATPGVPLVAPETIGVETGLISQPTDVATAGIDSITTGFGGATPGVIDVPPPTPVAPPGPVVVGGHIKPPVRIKYVMPEYPEIARDSRVQGLVILEAIIDADGKVASARVLRSNPLLEQAALAAVRAWEYTPTLLNGRPTPVIMTVTVLFTLK
jgi:periplasmic protein TonB